MRALVLSAGSTFGAYQAGVWQALEEARLPLDLFAGASIGALNAAAIARGASARRLQEWWRDPASNIFHDNWSRSLRRRLDEFLQEFPPTPHSRPLRVAATRLPSTRLDVFQDSQVTAAVLQASCAVPPFFAPVRVGGRLYIDGGVFCRLPVALAPEAAETLTVDLLADPPSRLLRLAMNAAGSLRRLLLGEPAPPSLRATLAITPSQSLGAIRDLYRWDPARINRWIDQGYRDTQRLLTSSRLAQNSAPAADNAAPP
jgi:predicted acylesterase/phospholipase RssA